MIRRALPFLLGTALLLGCRPIWTDVTPLGQHVLAPRPSTYEMVVFTQMPTDRKYEELALINVRAPMPIKEMIPELKAKACGLGADAVVIKSSTMAVGDHMAEVSAVAIRFL